MCHGQILSASLPRGREDHRCDECRRIIPAGRLSVHESVAFDGRVYSVRVCERCAAISDVSPDWDDCPLLGEARESARYAAEEVGWRVYLARIRENIRARRRQMRPKEFGEEAPDAGGTS